MLTSSALREFVVHATDGALDHVRDLFFEDDTWTVRYLVVEAGSWLRDRRVLISPIVVGRIDERARTVAVKLTQDQIASSPPVNTKLPLSRQIELRYRDYFAWPVYWVATFMSAYDRSHYPRLAEAEEKVRSGGLKRKEPVMSRPFDRSRPATADPHLRSAAKVAGYGVIATDGLAGHLHDFAIDTKGWGIAFLEIDLGHGRHVLLPPKHVRDMSWATRSIHLNISRRDLAKARPPTAAVVPRSRKQP